jgi:hypothetical protein
MCIRLIVATPLAELISFTPPPAPFDSQQHSSLISKCTIEKRIGKWGTKDGENIGNIIHAPVLHSTLSGNNMRSVMTLYGHGIMQQQISDNLEKRVQPIVNYIVMITIKNIQIYNHTHTQSGWSESCTMEQRCDFIRHVMRSILARLYCYIHAVQPLLPLHEDEKCVAGNVCVKITPYSN